jgi:polysaccharide export outer membrane protein
MLILIKRIYLTLIGIIFCTSAAAEVLLGPGDMVKASVYGNPDLAIETRMSENGTMTFPLLGTVHIGGLTTQQAERKIGELLEKGGYIKRAQVNLLITTFASQQISILGQVNRPGRYPADGPRKVLDLLAVAGGIGPEGGDLVTLVRTRSNHTTRETIDIVEMVRKGELNQDYDVTGGDIIFVERAPRAYILGEVQRPGSFRIERSMTVQQALAAGGGLTPRGSANGLRVTRRELHGRQNTIDAKNDDLIQADDVILVRESWF